MFKMEIETNSEAFDIDMDIEIVRIMREVEKQVVSGVATCGSCIDINGNKVGDWIMTDY